MKILNIFIFIFFSSIEVRVRAEVILNPENCLEGLDYCVIKNQGSKFQEKKDSYKISLGKDAIVIRHKWKEWSLAKGQVYIHAKDKISFDVPYGSVEIERGSQVLLNKINDQVSVRTLFGKVFLKPLGSKKPVVVLEGYENYLSEVDGSLKAQVGIPKPIVIESMLKDWALHTDLPKKDFLEEVEKFKPIHEKAVHELSILNEQIAQREIASAKEAKISSELRRKRAMEEQKRLKESYRSRLLGE